MGKGISQITRLGYNSSGQCPLVILDMCVDLECLRVQFPSAFLWPIVPCTPDLYIGSLLVGSLGDEGVQM